MNSLTTKQAAGQLLVAGLPAGEPPEAILALAAAGELGGFILFRRNLGSMPEAVDLVRRLSAACPRDLPPFVAVDQEGGRVARFREPVLKLPPMRALGELDDVLLTEQAARVLGRQLSLLGVNLDFAPVLDVDSNPANPVIGDRSFGRTPAQVIAHASAFARGLASAGVLACGKHFPGHGDTSEDSHLALPRVAHGRKRLDAIELAPFAALAKQLPLLMSAHVVFDAIDPGVPATLSRRALTKLLRLELGFAGLVFSDDLEMKAIADRYGIGDAAVRAIEAGCDTVLVCERTDRVLEAHAALCERAERDLVFRARVHASAARSVFLRRQHRPAPASPEMIEACLRTQVGEAEATAELLARLSLPRQV